MPPTFLNRVGSAFRRQPAAAVNAPPIPVIVNAAKNASTVALSNALKRYVTSIRNLRSRNPSGVTRNNLLTSTVANRTNINRALANYVMAVNKAKFLNAAVAQVIPLTPSGVTPTAPVTNLLNQATRENASLTRAEGILRQAGVNPGAVPGQNQQNIMKTLANANRIMKLSNANITNANAANLLANMNRLRTNVARLNSGFSPQGKKTVANAVSKLQTEITRRQASE